MASLPISRALREQVKQRADFRCKYCQTSEWLSGVEGEIDQMYGNRWSEDATRIIGITPCGRGTVEALRLNHLLAVSARTVWARAGYHPPPAIQSQS